MRKRDCRQGCDGHWFWNKIGRCQRCMDQLTVLSVACWIVWFIWFQEDPASIESITLIIGGFLFNALLFLHLWMKFVIFPWRRRQQGHDRNRP